MEWVGEQNLGGEEQQEQEIQQRLQLRWYYFNWLQQAGWGVFAELSQQQLQQLCRVNLEPQQLQQLEQLLERLPHCGELLWIYGAAVARREPGRPLQQPLPELWEVQLQQKYLDKPVLHWESLLRSRLRPDHSFLLRRSANRGTQASRPWWVSLLFRMRLQWRVKPE